MLSNDIHKSQSNKRAWMPLHWAIFWSGLLVDSTTERKQNISTGNGTGIEQAQWKENRTKLPDI